MINDTIMIEMTKMMMSVVRGQEELDDDCDGDGGRL